MRFDALSKSPSTLHDTLESKEKRSELFGKNVFNSEKMRQFLTYEALEKVKSAIFQGTKID